MLQCILSVACPELHLAKQFDKLRVNSVNAHLKQCSLTFLAHHGFYFLLRLLYHLLNSGRMDSAVYNQAFQSNSGNFPADWVKAGKDNRLRRIVNDQFHARQRLKGPDIASLTSDDSSLHLIVWKLDNGYCRLGHMVSRTALDCRYHVILGLLIGFLLGLCLHLLDELGRVVLYILLHGFQKIFLRLLGCKTGNFLQLLHSLLVEFLNLCGSLPQSFLFGVKPCFTFLNRF